MKNKSELAHRDIWRLAGPMILSNLSIPLLGVVDTAVIGHLEHVYYLGAVAVGSLIFSFVFWAFGFLRMGTTGLIAQALGAGQYDEVRAGLVRACLIAIVLAFVLLITQQAVLWLALTLLDASHQVEQYAAEYFSIRIWSAPATLINYVLIGWFLGMQNARGPLYLLLMINLSNIVLDLWFVWGLGMTVDGVALASVIAEYLGVVLGLYLVVKTLRNQPGRCSWSQVVDASRLKRLLVVNQNIFIRTVCLIFSFAFFTAQGAKHGDVILAANAVLMNFQTFMAYGLDGFAHAAEALIGKAVGENDQQRFRIAVRTAGLWSLLIAIVFMLLYALFGVLIINGLTDLAPVREAALIYLPWLIISPILSVWSYLYDGVFIGAIRTAEMRNTMLVSTFLFFLPAWYFLQPWGNHGLWAALMIFMLARGISMAISYRYMQKQGLFFA